MRPDFEEEVNAYERELRRRARWEKVLDWTCITVGLVGAVAVLMYVTFA